MYTPPFTVSAKAINLISEISANLERFVIRMESEDGIRLRKVNRMKTIHGMLAIEGNTLSENMIWENQSAYYKAIQDSTDANDSGIFVDFMLGIILDAIKQNPHLTMGELSEIVGIAKKNIFNNMKKLQEAGLLVRPGADKNGWWEVIES
nr:MarR family transcriptional regulator [Treponema sp.]